MNQVKIRLNFSPGHPTQCESSILVGMGLCFGAIILKMTCGIFGLSLVWGRYLDQGRSTKMDEVPDSSKISFCEFKGG